MFFMKKISTSMAFLILCLLFLSSCTTSESLSEYPPAELSSSSHLNAHAENNRTEKINFSNPESPFQMISSADITSYGSGNSAGYYGIYINADASKNILYTDYETASQVYLCNQPNCMHDTETCTSWIPPDTGKVVAAATDELLFLLVSNSQSASYIECRDLNGANSHRLYTLPDGATMENAVAANDRFLIVSVVQITQEKGSIVRNTSLQLIDIETGQATVLLALSDLVEKDVLSGAEMRFLGLSEAGSILDISVQHAYEYDPNDIEKSFQNQNNAMVHTIYVMPLDGSKPYSVLSYRNGECVVSPMGGWLFALKSDDTGKIALDRIVPRTGETLRLIEDFQNTFLKDKARNTSLTDYVFRNYVDNTLIINVMSNNYVDESGSMQMVFSGMLINADTGEVRELSLTNFYHATVVPVGILAHCDDKLLVMARITESQNSGGITSLKRETGLISIADFLHSDPNYQMIQSIRFYD